MNLPRFSNSKSLALTLKRHLSCTLACTFVIPIILTRNFKSSNVTSATWPSKRKWHLNSVYETKKVCLKERLDRTWSSFVFTILELKEKYQIDLDQLKQLPFQIQVTYTAADGSKALRVLTQSKETTENRDVAEVNAIRSVIAENHIRSTANDMMFVSENVFVSNAKSPVFLQGWCVRWGRLRCPDCPLEMVQTQCSKTTYGLHEQPSAESTWAWPRRSRSIQRKVSILIGVGHQNIFCLLDVGMSRVMNFNRRSSRLDRVRQDRLAMVNRFQIGPSCRLNATKKELWLYPLLQDSRGDATMALTRPRSAVSTINIRRICIDTKTCPPTTCEKPARRTVVNPPPVA